MSQDFNTPPSRMRIVLEGPLRSFGLRPNVYRIAQRLRLTGWVRNLDTGLEIEIEGPSCDLDTFLYEFKALQPVGLKEALDSILWITPIHSMWFEILPDLNQRSRSSSKP